MFSVYILSFLDLLRGDYLSWRGDEGGRGREMKAEALEGAEGGIIETHADTEEALECYPTFHCIIKSRGILRSLTRHLCLDPRRPLSCLRSSFRPQKTRLQDKEEMCKDTQGSLDILDF